MACSGQLWQLGLGWGNLRGSCDSAARGRGSAGSSSRTAGSPLPPTGTWARARHLHPTPDTPKQLRAGAMLIPASLSSSPPKGRLGEPGPAGGLPPPCRQPPPPAPHPGPYLGPAESAPPCCTCPWLPSSGQAERKGREAGRREGVGKRQDSLGPGFPTQLRRPGSASQPPLSQRGEQSRSWGLRGQTRPGRVVDLPEP